MAHDPPGKNPKKNLEGDNLREKPPKKPTQRNNATYIEDNIIIDIMQSEKIITGHHHLGRYLVHVPWYTVFSMK